MRFMISRNTPKEYTIQHVRFKAHRVAFSQMTFAENDTSVTALNPAMHKHVKQLSDNN